MYLLYIFFIFVHFLINLLCSYSLLISLTIKGIKIFLIKKLFNFWDIKFLCTNSKGLVFLTGDSNKRIDHLIYTYLASGRTSWPENFLRFCKRSLSRMVVSALCSQQSAITEMILPSSSFSSYALMKWNVTKSGTSTLVT